MYKSGIHNSLCCAVCAFAFALAGTGSRAGAQTPAAGLSFEVATVKPVLMDASHPFTGRHFWAHVTPAGASYWSMTIAHLVEYAYDVEPFQVTGPEWTNADRFDIEARFPDGADKKDDRKMLQALLKDRFKLTFHIEKRELETYFLVVGKNGAKLRPSTPDPPEIQADAAVKPADGNAGEMSAKPVITMNADGVSTIQMGKKGTQTLKFNMDTWANHWEFSKMTMEELAGRLRSCLGSSSQHVENQTGISGIYQVSLDCPLPGPPATMGRDAATMASVPDGSYTLAQSLDALGLRLEKRKVLMDVYVIDHVEKPSAN